MGCILDREGVRNLTGPPIDPLSKRKWLVNISAHVIDRASDLYDALLAHELLDDMKDSRIHEHMLKEADYMEKSECEDESEEERKGEREEEQAVESEDEREEEQAVESEDEREDERKGEREEERKDEREEERKDEQEGESEDEREEEQEYRQRTHYKKAFMRVTRCIVEIWHLLLAIDRDWDAYIVLAETFPSRDSPKIQEMERLKRNALKLMAIVRTRAQQIDETDFRALREMGWG
jgi:cobalamin biosynthesis protein CobT